MQAVGEGCAEIADLHVPGEIRNDDLEIAERLLAALSVNGQRMAVGPELLAIGHSARDTVCRLVRRGDTV
ncbi:MAG: hypothetical protein ACREA0_23270, partial [bacterium]